MADIATAFPTPANGGPGFQAVNFKINTPGQITESMSGKIRRVGFGVSYYTWEVRYPNLKPLDAGTVTGYLSQALGQQFSFEITLPEISYTNVTNQTSTTPRTTTTFSRGSISVTLTNCGVSKNVLAAGDFFKFNNHSKVYMCTAPCTSNSSGAATLFFSCPLVTNVPTSTNLTITAVPFTAILEETEQSFDVGIGGITTMSLSMREVWS
jgi:hypothetical protein